MTSAWLSLLEMCVHAKVENLWASLLLIVFGASGLTELLRHDHRVQMLALRLENYDNWFVNFFKTLYNCGFCLSHWSAILVVTAWLFIPYGHVPVYVLAVTRASNILNDCLYKFNRSPNKKRIHDDATKSI